MIHGKSTYLSGTVIMLVSVSIPGIQLAKSCKHIGCIKICALYDVEVQILIEFIYLFSNIFVYFAVGKITTVLRRYDKITSVILIL